MNKDKVIDALKSVIAAVKEAPEAEPNESNRFKKLDDGWVMDRLLGLDWGPSSDETMDFKSAKKYCKNLGARLPESHELMSLIDHSRRQPACLLNDMKHDDWYWTGTLVAGYPGGAWCVSFLYGSVFNFNKGSNNYVRPVRTSKEGQ